MALSPGTRLGPYQVVARIGAGGMGEVYRATDTKLGRDVAVKVLPDSVALDRSRLARFDREARALASLNHPNIATVHGLEDQGGTTALVMEFVDGVTLADRIAKGPIPQREALAIGRQIADALEAAHERGIVHRDLKPGNVMIRRDGTVKVLDFGLAKDLGYANVEAETATVQTVAGVMVGTPAYMSPEQARGEAVDRRTDIWALGCVLFEMLTRTRPFGGSTTADTVSQVLTHEIDWGRIPGDVPSAVTQLLRRCLERDVRRRLRDVGEARVLLEDPGSLASAPPRAPERSAAHRSSGRYVAMAAGGALLAGVVIGALVARNLPRESAPATITHTAILLPEGGSFNYPGRRFLAISPTGSHVAYSSAPGLWIRALNERNPQLLPGVANDARSPFFSPDGQSLGYYASGAIWRISLSGGAPTRITSSINPWNASWEADGTILYGQGPDGIWRVSDKGGEGKRIIAASDGETLMGPQLLPGGEWARLRSGTGRPISLPERRDPWRFQGWRSDSRDPELA